MQTFIAFGIEKKFMFLQEYHNKKDIIYLPYISTDKQYGT